jgi:hypothetical protein
MTITPKKMKIIARILENRDYPGCPPCREGNCRVRTKINIPRAVKISPLIRSLLRIGNLQSPYKPTPLT